MNDPLVLFYFLSMISLNVTVASQSLVMEVRHRCKCFIDLLNECKLHVQCQYTTGM